jgi:outer membrane lipoprotein SlyB
VESVRAIEVDNDASSQPAGPAGLTSASSGAYGNVESEKNARKRTSYRVTVRMDDGTARTLYQSAPPGFSVGSKVKVINGQLSARG